MLNTPDPENATRRETEIEITDLNASAKAGRVPGRPTGQGRVFSFQARIWMSISVIAGMALLVAIVLVSVSHVPKKTVPLLQINSQVSLSVVDGICYATSTNGVETALRVSDGRLLWHRVVGTTGEESATVVGGVIYLSPLIPFDSIASTIAIKALRASDGSPLWDRTLPRDSRTLFQLTAMNSVVYVRSSTDSINALRASDGSLLWHYTARTLSVSTVADGIVYAGTQDDHLYALRASDGFLLWTYTSLTPPQLLSPVVANGKIYLNLQSGGMDVLRADNGILLWRYTPRLPALRLFPQPLVANGAVYALTQDSHLYALRSSDGFTIWRAALQTTNILPLLSEASGVIYTEASDGSIYALNESSGSVLWHHQGVEGGVASITVAQGVIYLVFYITGLNTIGSITALQASDGSVLWHYAPPVPVRQLSPVDADSLVLLASQDGGIDALGASSGTLRWHRTMNS